MKSWWSKLASRLGGLKHIHSLDDLVLFVRMLLLAMVVPLFMRLRLPRAVALLEPKRLPVTVDEARIEQIMRLMRPVLQVGRPLIRPDCLTRSLTYYYFLRRAGLDVGLRFGIGQMPDSFEGHCWLVKDGEPFLEVTDPRPFFSEIYRFPQMAARSS
jgi:hypothetical protein